MAPFQVSCVTAPQPILATEAKEKVCHWRWIVQYSIPFIGRKDASTHAQMHTHTVSPCPSKEAHSMLAYMFVIPRVPPYYSSISHGDTKPQFYARMLDTLCSSSSVATILLLAANSFLPEDKLTSGRPPGMEAQCFRKWRKADIVEI